jgi:DNA repair exonuclease SbcCD ATPase subunit
LSWISYGLKAPPVARVQKEVLQYVAGHLARLRRHEQDFTAALGRAARKHGLVPAGTEDLVSAVEREESRAGSLHAAATAAGPDASGEAELAALKQNQAALMKRVAEAQEKVARGDARLNELKAREQALRQPPRPGLSEQEKAARVREYESVQAERKNTAADLAKLREQLGAAERPVREIEAEMARIRTQGRSSGPPGRASGRQGGASRAIIELDEEIGRAVLHHARSPALLQLTGAVETCQSRIRELEQVQADQQAELALYSEGRARAGFWGLIGGALVLLLVLLLAGEGLRQLLLK